MKKLMAPVLHPILDFSSWGVKGIVYKIIFLFTALKYKHNMIARESKNLMFYSNDHMKDVFINQSYLPSL